MTEPSRPQSRGSTGSLSSASTPKTHSWTRRSGSPRDEALERLDAERELAQRERALRPERRAAQPLEVLRRGVLRAVDDPQVLAAAALHRRLHEPALAARDEVAAA